MRSQTSRKGRAVIAADDGDWDDDERPRSVVTRILAWPKKDLFGLVLCIGASTAILVNALFLQSGPHPAPLFSNIIPAAPVEVAPVAATPTVTKVAARDIPIVRIAAPATPAEATGAVPVVLPRPRPEISPPRTVEAVVARVEPQAQSQSQRTRGELIAEIQRELSRRGFFIGPADGFYGPKTDTAIRDFEHAAKLKPSVEPTEVLLASIIRSNVAATPQPQAQPQSQPQPQAVSQPRPPAAVPATGQPRIVAAQRALSEWGYGQLRPTGQIDAETKVAIEKFERDRRLPISGQLSDRVTRELAAVTGRPLE